MEKSAVYFTDLRVTVGTSLLDKLKKLLQKAGIGEIDFDGKLTAIKINFGEPGNLAYLRPNYAKAVADLVKELGGVPFLKGVFTAEIRRASDAGMPILVGSQCRYEGSNLRVYETGQRILE